MDIKELRKKIFAYAKSMYVGRALYMSVAGNVNITASGIKHALSRGYGQIEIKFHIIANLLEVLGTARFTSKEENKSITKLNIKGIYNYFSFITIKEKSYVVWIKIQENNEGKKEFYDCGVMKE